MQPKTVYCIIVTYNGIQWIERCLQSLVSSSYPNYIIVIDNASTDETVSFIKKRFPGVHLVETGKNLGFGQGNNIGLTMALQDKADYVFLLNQDAWVQKDTLAALVAAHSIYNGYGIVSPVHLNGAGDDFDPYFYDYLIGSDIKSSIQSLFFEKATEPLIDTPFVNAAAWLISYECLEATGGFDPIFFHYGEDDNYAHRVQYKGFKIGIVAGTKIFHDKNYGTATIKNISELFRHDWTILLHQACNINHTGYRRLLVKRCGRYFIQGCWATLTLNRNAAFYNFSMVRNIIFSIAAIAKARETAISVKTPYLQINPVTFN